jgi:hypothetical protein
MSTFIHRVSNRSQHYAQLIVLSADDKRSYDLVLGPGESVNYRDIYGEGSAPVPTAESAFDFDDSHILVRVGDRSFALYDEANKVHQTDDNTFNENAPLLAGFAGPGPMSLTITGDGQLRGEVMPLYAGAQLAAVSWAPSRYAIYGMDTQGGLAQKAWLSKDWDDWRILPGPAAGLQGPLTAVSWTSTRYAVYGLGQDGFLYEKAWLTNRWENWTQHAGPVGVTLLDLAATSWQTDRYGLYAIGSNGLLYQKWWGLNQWHDWEELGQPAGIRLTGPMTAVSWGAFRYGIYALGADGDVWQKWYGLGWSKWESIGKPGSPLKTLTSVSWQSGQYLVAGVADDGSLWVREYQNGWKDDWKYLGHPGDMPLAGPVAAVSWRRGAYAFYAQGDDGLTYELYKNNWQVLNGR